MLKIYNTMTGKKEEFLPLKRGKVGMYVCGVTVYDECHLGHARTYVAFDTIRRYLEYKGLEVNYVQNFTDIDDKIINKAREEKRKGEEVDLSILIKDIVEKYTGEYFACMDKLNIKKATCYPKATECIPEMIEIIKRLIEKGYGYEVDGNVYFSVKSFSEYGKLSKRNLDECSSESRLAPEEQKRNPMDFALWKKGKKEEPSWDSPWGRGRPGWHIECSAMSMKYLGESFDIHAGGEDLIFPHHENEIAQSEGYNNKSLARYWLHTGFVTLRQEKMSKSSGNFFTVREMLEKYPPVAVRLFLLSAHYRKPIEVSEEHLEAAKRATDRIAACLSSVERSAPGTRAPEHQSTRAPGTRITSYQLPVTNYQSPITNYQLPITNHQSPITSDRIAMENAMDDDFNIPVVMGIIFKLVSNVNVLLKDGDFARAKVTAADIESFCNVLGLKFRADKEIEEELLSLIREREQFRQRKLWEEADVLRQTLLSKGIALEDTPHGTKWRKL